MLTIKEENNHDHITWCRKVKVKVTQLCPTLCNPMGLVHGILQARLLEWVSFPFSRGSSQPRDWTQVFYIAGGFLTSWATRKAQEYWIGYPIPSPADLPNPGIEPGSPALQADSLPADLPEKPTDCSYWYSKHNQSRSDCFHTLWNMSI